MGFKESFFWTQIVFKRKNNILYKRPIGLSPRDSMSFQGMAKDVHVRISKQRMGRPCASVAIRALHTCQMWPL